MMLNKDLVNKMRKLTDKIVIFIVCLALYVPNTNSFYMIVPVLIAVILSATVSYFEDDRLAAAVFAAYLIACFYHPYLLFFIPLMAYDILFSKFMGIGLLSFLPLIADPTQVLILSKWIIAAFMSAAYVLKNRTVALENMEKEYHTLRDNMKEISLQLERQNKELLDKQDYEINLATVTERNRIARDIHDNVGHLLSRSILQIGALLAVHKDEAMEESLRQLKDTLSEAMDSIRRSVHDLHEQSIDLRMEIQKLVNNFRFCSIKYTYDVQTNPEKSIKYCFIAVAKEALSNIIKHTNATEVSVIIREHPALYQLTIQDNGTQISSKNENGIGLKNIADRVAALGGNFNVSTNNGFRIFISVPKSKSVI